MLKLVGKPEDTFYNNAAHNMSLLVRKPASPFPTRLSTATEGTVMNLNFRTDKSGQTVQTQIRLLLEEQSDQGLHCLLFHLHVFDKIPSGFASLFEF